MKKAWKIFWKSLTSILKTIGNVAEAGEKYSESVKDAAEYDRAKAQRKHAKKLAAFSVAP